MARYRRLQSWYREVQLGVPEPGVGQSGRRLGSMLPSAAVASQPDLNFLTPAAFDHAERRMEIGRLEGVTLDKDRLRRNLLSSMPLCFNVFGSLGTHPAFIRLVRDLIDPGAAQIRAADCEWAPQPPSAHLGDRSAFGAFITYWNEQGHSCFIGVETKYAEPFKRIEYNRPVYARITEESGWFKPGAFDALKATKTNQLWRTVMLAASIEDGDEYQRGEVLLLTLADDPNAADCAATVQHQLVDPSRLHHVTLEGLVEAARSIGDPDLSAWADRFVLRYLDVGPVGPDRGH